MGEAKSVTGGADDESGEAKAEAEDAEAEEDKDLNEDEEDADAGAEETEEKAATGAILSGSHATGHHAGATKVHVEGTANPEEAAAEAVKEAKEEEKEEEGSASQAALG